jgi:hypothetical protein
MKSIYAALFFILIIYSCQKDALLYSCDPVLNEIITSHIEVYAQYTVEEITVSDIQIQRAIFRSFEPAKKREIWLEKIRFLLENEDYTPAEYIHTTKILDHLSENYFNEDSIKAEAGTRALFFSDWISYAKGNLGWSEKYIAFVIYRLYTVQEQMDAEISTVKIISRKAISDSEIGTCDCSLISDGCFGSVCGDGTCEQTSGCGLLWQYTCDGICQ